MVGDGGSNGLFRQLIESHLCVLCGFCGESSPYFGKGVLIYHRAISSLHAKIPSTAAS